VEHEVSPGRWKISLDGRSLIIASDLPMKPGQKLKLISAGEHSGMLRWRFVADPTPSTTTIPASLWAAFASQGLPLVQPRLEAWSRWMRDRTAPSDLESWVASMDARGLEPGATKTEALTPWLDWQAALERGLRLPPPAKDDEWYWSNLTQHPQGNPWLVMPLHWKFEENRDSGLLQAHWDSRSMAIDRWNLTAAPAGVPFRLEAQNKNPGTSLTWRFFRAEDRAWAESWLNKLGGPSFLAEQIEIRIDGPSPVWRGIDVQA